MSYILTVTAKRKNAKRHIVERGTIEDCRRLANNMNEKYIVEIYNGKWELVETIRA